MMNCNCQDCQELGLNGLVPTTYTSPMIPVRHKYNPTTYDIYDTGRVGSGYPPTSYLPAPLSGLGGFTMSIDVVGTVTGAVIGIALNQFLGWNNWLLSAAVGAISGGVILPSIQS